MTPPDQTPVPDSTVARFGGPHIADVIARWRIENGTIRVDSNNMVIANHGPDDILTILVSRRDEIVAWWRRPCPGCGNPVDGPGRWHHDHTGPDDTVCGRCHQRRVAAEIVILETEQAEQAAAKAAAEQAETERAERDEWRRQKRRRSA